MAVKKLSVFAERMMPAFVHRDHEQFTKFIKYYFEFLEQTDGVYDYAGNSLEYMDIDYTKNHILEEFRNTYLINFPEETDVDLRFLVKQIREFYKSKGSEKSYEFLFRLLYGDDDIDIYYPKLDILRSSDGKWVEDAGYALGGYWENTDGQLSSDKKLQDNYYYQDFSYEIITDVTRFYYENVIKENVHVTGQLMFGRNIIANDVPMSMEWLDYDKYERTKLSDLGLNLLWGGGYTIATEEQNDHTILVDVNGVIQEEDVEYPFLSITGSYSIGDVIGIRRLDHALGANETFAGDDGTDYQLDGDYTADQLLIWVDGLKVSDWTIAGSPTTITFGTAVAIGSTIKVLKHTIQSSEVHSGVETDKHIVLDTAPQGYLLNKIIVFVDGIIRIPDWYDPLTNRVYFTDYLTEGVNNVEVIHMEALGYFDSVNFEDAITKYNINTNKNPFKEHPTSPYVTVVNPTDDIRPKLDDSITSIFVFVTPTDDIKISLLEKVEMLLNWVPTTFEINPAQTDELTLNGTDISFSFPSTIESTSTDLTLFSVGNSITITTTSGLNNGVYIINSVTENKILIAQSSLSNETDVEAGTTTITAIATGYNFNDDNPDSIVASVAKWGDVQQADYAVVTNASNPANNGDYRIVASSPTTLTLDGLETLTADTDDTSATIQIIRETVHDRIYTNVVEGPNDPNNSLAAQVTAILTTKTDSISPHFSENAVILDLFSDLTDSIETHFSEGTTVLDVSLPTTDSIETHFSEGTTSITGTVDATDISYEAGKDTTAQTDISFTSPSTITSGGTFDFTAFSSGDLITITGASDQNGTYHISSTAPTATVIVVDEATITTEASGDSVTITAPDRINSVSTDLDIYDADDTISTDASLTNTNDGTYNIHATEAPTTRIIFVDESVTDESAATAGTVTITRTRTF